MGIKCGIVGLPNVGKSTLFNALTKAGIAAANFPFCTIEPNTGVVPVPDPRLAQLAEIVKPQKTHRRPRSSSWTSPAWSPAPRRARAWATSSWPISARWTPSPTWCAASSTATSSMSNRQGRSDLRHRDHRHRAGAGRPGLRRKSADRAPKSWLRPAIRTRSCSKEVLARIRDGLDAGQAGAGAGPDRRGQGRGARPVPADPQAGDVRRQRARGRLREQSVPGQGPGPRRGRGRPGGAGQRRDRGRAVPARGCRPGRVPGRHGPGRAGPEPGDPGRLHAAGHADLLHRRA